MPAHLKIIIALKPWMYSYTLEFSFPRPNVKEKGSGYARLVDIYTFRAYTLLFSCMSSAQEIIEHAAIAYTLCEVRWL